MRLPLPKILLIFLLTLSLTTIILVAEAQPIREIAYNDGDFEATVYSGERAVKLSLPSGWPSARLLTARYYIKFDPETFIVHIYDGDGSTELIPSFEVTPSGTGWFNVDLSSFDLTVTGDFYISIEWIYGENSEIGLDSSNPDGRSYYATDSGWSQQPFGENYGIQAVVQQAIQPTQPYSSITPLSSHNCLRNTTNHKENSPITPFFMYKKREATNLPRLQM